MAEIHLKMVDGETHVLTIPEGEDVNEVLRNARDDPGAWISVDDETWIRRENVVSTRMLRNPLEPLVGFSE